ncbi:uncharacterized protein [Nicotiana tomentosiformis]|uniref:uncharacterized protein n=1 Tax=Nicotiana tomentosiformis TaxID=4098 RepID=UPI00388CC3F1
MEVKRVIEGMDGDEAVAAMEEEEATVTTSTMELKSTRYSKAVVVDIEEEEDVATTKKIMDKEEVESTLLMALKEEDKDDCSSWYLDNGASNHMCGCKEKFVEINKTVKVHMAKNRLFSLNLKTIDAKCLKANVQDESWCWHMRFEHLNFEELKSMGEKNVVHGIPSISHPNQLCEACLLGKHARRSFPKEAMSRSTKPL